MFQGFYTLTSGVLTQNRNLNVISNNMSNASTPGFKADRMIISDFYNEMMIRTGNKNKSDTTRIGSMSLIAGGDETTTDYTQGGLSVSNSTLDFSILGDGFFPIQTDNGTVYTRNGNFSLDDDGYLCLPGVGRVLGDGGTIYLGTDRITVDGTGRIFNEQTGAQLGQLTVVDFADYAQLNKENGNVFTTNANAVAADADIQWKTLENSNADPIDQMTRMMASERALQSSAQILSIYDELISQMRTMGPTA